MKNLKLTATEKDFFKKVRLAIVANPFSDEREAVNSQLTQSKSSLSNKKLVELLIKTVEEQLSLTCSGEKKPILCFQGEDRELVQYGVLFYIFHKYCSNFDQHIGNILTEENVFFWGLPGSILRDFFATYTLQQPNKNQEEA